MLRYLENLLDDDGLDDLRERDSVAGFLFLVVDPVLFEPGVLLEGDPVEKERVRPVDDQRQQESQRLVAYERKQRALNRRCHDCLLFVELEAEEVGLRGGKEGR